MAADGPKSIEELQGKRFSFGSRLSPPLDTSCRAISCDHAATVAQNILDNLSKPYELEGQEVVVSGTISISMYPQDGQDVTALLKNADAAMYMAKSEGRNRYQFYSKGLTQKTLRTLALETKLHRALECNEFVMH